MAEVTRDRTSPLYIRIAEDIKSRIGKGERLPNTRIPTEMELSTRYGVSRITVRKALEILVDEEILVRKQQIGIFISDKKLSRSLNSFMGFSQTCEVAGHRPGTRLLSAELVRAAVMHREALKLQEEDMAIRIRRLRYCDDLPVILEENHFPKEYAWLLAEDLSISLHQLLQNHGIVLGNGTKTIGVCYATREEAEWLEIKEKDALIVSRDVVYNTAGEPVYSGKETINADRYEYRILANSVWKEA